MEVKKIPIVNWFGTCTFICSPNESCVVISKSYDAKNRLHTQLLLFHEALIRIKEMDIKAISCFHAGKT